MGTNTFVGQTIHVRLESWGRLGECTAWIDDRLAFVFGGIPGEEVLVEIIDQRRKFLYGKVVEVLVPSPYRIKSPCHYFGACTGCQWQHIEYNYQLQLKHDAVLDALKRVGGFTTPTVSLTLPSPDHYGYRNHARFTVGHEGSLGFVNRATRQFVPIDDCMIMDAGINRILNILQHHCGETTQLSIRYGVNTKDFLIQPTLKTSHISIPTGQKHYNESLRNKYFRVASPSFFQVNIKQMDNLINLVREELRLSGSEVIVDAYAGVGTFALLLNDHTAKVIAIEESPAAIEDALVNSSDTPNVEFIQGKTETILNSMQDSPHGIILDPPRKGCHPSTLDVLNRLRPKRIVYVSCDPITLARDLKILCDGAFYLEKVHPVDMFPQTHHIECIASLSLKRNLKNFVLASSSPRRNTLLESIGLIFEIDAPDVEENHGTESPKKIVERLALAKAESVVKRHPNCLILGADTLVSLKGKVLGKPKTKSEATEMLKYLRGTTHKVITGLALIDTSSGMRSINSSESMVTMPNFSDEDIETYVSTGKSIDKAGAYGIQDDSLKPALEVNGCYTNVVGLPICSLVQLLNNYGFETGSLTIPDSCLSHNDTGHKSP